MPSDDLQSLVPAWRSAARDLAIHNQIESIYARVSSEIEARGPACWASGRCCNFKKTGHLLYVTGLEAAAALLPIPNRDVLPPTPLPRGKGPGEGSSSSLTLPQVTAAQARGDCPFLTHNLCGIHTTKPLGCRIYFCDRSAQRWQEDLSERALREIRALHESHQVEYRYAEWRTLLSAFAGEGVT